MSTGHDADRSPTEAERAEALALLSRLRDGRPVEPAAAAWARALAERDAEMHAMLLAWDRQAAVLAAEPGVVASADFTDCVVAAACGQEAEPAELLVLPLARRLAVAAALLLAVTLGWSLAHPAALRADRDVQRTRHAVDGFRKTPFAPDDLQAGLIERYKEHSELGGLQLGGAAEGPR